MLAPNPPYPQFLYTANWMLSKSSKHIRYVNDVVTKAAPQAYAS
jgi:hypothetical protein